MHKHKIELVTLKDIYKFVEISVSVESDVKLIDGNGFCVNGKSLLGAAAALEWDNLYCISDEDIYEKIKRFCTED